MKLGEIKLEALMMMCPGVTFNVSMDNLEEAIMLLKNDSSYSDYFSKMPGAINRCFGILEQKGVLPNKVAEMLLSNGEYLGPYCRYRLNTIVPDYRAIEKISYVNDNEYQDMRDYKLESTNTVLLPYQKEGKYILVYLPKLARVSLLTSENTEILEDREDIASLIPYFIKSELLYSESSDEAKLARSLFESAVNELASHRESYQGKVETVYD